MTPAQWQAVKELFDQALDLAPAERASFIDSASKDSTVRSEVLRLLNSWQGAESWVEETGKSIFQAATAPAFDTDDVLAGRYLINRFIARGGMGEVYEAFDRQQQIAVAVKTMRNEHFSDRIMLEMLRRELNVARSVTHPNVCRLFDFHVDPGNLAFLTMELLDGETLSKYLEEHHALSADEIERIAYQIFAGLDAAHAEGVVHRDLKSSNIMLTEGSKRVHIMDFGLARSVNLSTPTDASVTSPFIGTPSYMAPEQLRGERATFKSDIHALGVVMFEMFAGRQPFHGSTPVETAALRLKDAAPSPRRFCPNIDRSWEYAILRCLEADPEQRPSSIKELKELLKNGPPIFWHRRHFAVGSALIPFAGAGMLWSLASEERATIAIEAFLLRNETELSGLDPIVTGFSLELIRQLQSDVQVKTWPRYSTRSGKETSKATFRLDGRLVGRLGMPIYLEVILVDNRADTPIWHKKIQTAVDASPRFIPEQINTLSMEILSAAKKYANYGVKLSSAGAVFNVAQRWQMRATVQGAGTNIPEALDQYLKGYALLQEVTSKSIEGAIAHLQKAILIDSHFALAYAALSQATIYQINYTPRPILDVMAEARQHAERAISEYV